MFRRTLLALVALFAVTAAADAQVNVTPLIGGYVPADDWSQLKTNAESYVQTRQGRRSLGLNVEVGSFRGSVAYASNTAIKDADRQEVGRGSVYGIASDVVMRPLMRMVVQPYLVLGAGVKFYAVDQVYSSDAEIETRRFAGHFGAGLDLMVGPVGVAAEITNFLNKGRGLNWNGHDAFFMAGMRVKLP
jgi:hypothetical protein